MRLEYGMVGMNGLSCFLQDDKQIPNKARQMMARVLTPILLVFQMGTRINACDDQQDGLYYSASSHGNMRERIRKK